MSLKSAARGLLASLWLLCGLAQADERILAFHSDIEIAADGSMLVTETIRVRAEGVNIRRGIYRTFPTRYRDRLGNAYRVDFDVIGLTRDGRSEPWNAYGSSNGVRVDFGNDDFLPVPGEFEYALQYRTTRQLGYFDEHDELYWNVTGNGWDFPIDAASATVTLPTQVPSTELAIEGYTGAFGGRGQSYTATLADGQGSIRTTQVLPPRSGLTLVLSWPKGVVSEPTRVQQVVYVVEDNSSVLIAVLTLLGVAAWLGSAWTKVGRDPEPGVIFPHYAPPDDFSPAAARYVTRMGYDSETFTAAVVNLAVKGHIHITQDKSTFLGMTSSEKYVLQRVESTQQLAADERVVLDLLFAAGPTLELVNKNHATVSGAQMAHAGVLKRQGSGRYFLNNGRYLLPSFLGSLAMLVLCFVLGTVVPLAVFIFVGIAILHLVFAFLMRAPTLEGRTIMDKLEGFKLYLDVAEKEEMNLRNPPELTPQLFEKFLPFAIALGVEQAWAERFERALALMPEHARAAYHPLWYTGHFNPARMNDFTQAVGSGFNSAISSASAAPGSSSGSGGGGFSGGGGGGGGGGGR